MARSPKSRRNKIAAVIVLYFEFFYQILLFIVKLSEELHGDLIEFREVPTNWETPIARQIARRTFMNTITSHGNVSPVMLVRMNCRCFQKLCQLLVSEGGLRCSWNIEIDEMVAIFLYTIAHNEKNRILQVVFRRSGETISRVIHLVLIAVLKLHKILYHTPKPIAEDSTEPRWKYFKNCLGALDGTLITLRVPKESQQRYRTRKGTLAMNVLGVCNSDMEFIYTLAGWEGSAHDGRVLRDALIRPNGLKVSKGHYYLCDAGYSNCEGFLAPYR